jgi:hypothetical protein
MKTKTTHQVEYNRIMIRELAAFLLLVFLVINSAVLIFWWKDAWYRLEMARMARHIESLEATNLYLLDSLEKEREKVKILIERYDPDLRQ